MDQHDHQLDDHNTSHTDDLDSSTPSSVPLIKQDVSSSTRALSTSTADGWKKSDEVRQYDQELSYSSRSTPELFHRVAEVLYDYRTALYILIIFVLLCIFSLILLRTFDHNDSGFLVSSSSDTIQFGWKYGPTAIFVIFLAIWRQADYVVKIRAPWKQMTAGFIPAHKSVLLDYISPILPVAFVRATRNRHWEVIISMIVFALLKLAVFGSTGLLNLQPTMIANQRSVVNLVVNKTLPSNNIYANRESAGRAYIAALQRQLPWPNGTMPDAAFQEMSTENNFSSESTVTANVLAVYPWLECEPGNASLSITIYPTAVGKRDVLGPTTDFALNFTSQHTNGTLGLYSNGFCDAYNESASCPQSLDSYALGPTTWNADEGDIDGNSMEAAFVFTTLSLTTRIRSDTVPINMSDLNGTEMSVEEWRGYGWVQNLDWASVIACKTRYAVETGKLTSLWSASERVWSNDSLSLNLTHTNRMLGNYPTTNLTTDIIDAAAKVSRLVEQISGSPASIRTSWFELMLYVTNATNLTSFRDPQAMIRPANTVFKGLTSVWMGSWVNFPDHSSTLAAYSYESSRLRMSQSAFWLMETSLIITLVLLILLLILSSKFNPYNFPDTILQDALLLARSDRPLYILKGLGSLNEQGISHSLASTSFNVKFHQRTHLKIDYRTDPTVWNAPSRPEILSPRTWSTWSSQLWYTIMLVSVCLCAIAILEVLQRLSDHLPEGIPTRLSRQNAQDITSFATAFILLMISMLFSSADFTVTGLTPYLLLWRKATPLHHLRNSPLRQLPPISIFRRVQTHQWSIVSIMIAALLGSILTIIGSALFIIVGDTKSYPTRIKTLDTFDMSTPLSSNSSGALVFSFIQNNNGSFVDGTYNEFAFPKFSIDTSDAHAAALSQLSQTTIAIEMPVIRASLNCSRVPRSAMTLEAINEPHQIRPEFSAFEPPYANVTSDGILPEECRGASPVYSNSETYRVSSSIGIMRLAEGNITYGAELENINGILRDNTTQLSSHDNDYFTHYPPGCPSVSFTIGSYTINSTDVSTTTRMVCSQYWEEVPAVLTFTLPELTLNSTRPPVLHENQATVVSRLSWNLTNVFGYRLPTVTTSSGPDSTDMLDRFYYAVMYGPDGVPFDELIGDQNYDRFFNATQHTYRQYMAQIVGNDMRTTSLDGVSDNSTTPMGTVFAATIADTTQVRIVQSKNVKIVLQSVLAAMVLFLIAGSPDLIACGKILTHSPFHIAGRMSLLAGSEFVERYRSFGVREDGNSELIQECNGNVRLKMQWWQLGLKSSPDTSVASHKNRNNFNEKGLRGEATEIPRLTDDVIEESHTHYRHDSFITKFQIERKPVSNSHAASYQPASQRDEHGDVAGDQHHNNASESLQSSKNDHQLATQGQNSNFRIDIIK